MLQRRKNMNSVRVSMAVSVSMMLAATVMAAGTGGEAWQSVSGGGACGRASGDYSHVDCYSDDTVSHMIAVGVDDSGQLSVSHSLVVRTLEGAMGTNYHLNQGRHGTAWSGGWMESDGPDAAVHVGGAVSPHAAQSFGSGSGWTVRGANHAQHR
jgi:hypothetical protein